MSGLLERLIRRRVVILFGKGGVGKTTTAAALALAASRRGARVLAMECDPRAPMAAAFGRDASFDPLEVGPGLFLMVLDGRHSLEEYLRIVLPGQVALRAVFASRLYQYFVNAAPGLRELMMLGKVCYEAEHKALRRSAWDLIVVDAPASGQALGLLGMPFAAQRLFGESLVGREARHITRMLRDTSQCLMLQVAIAEPFSVTETIESNVAAAELGLTVEVIVLNRCARAGFSAADVARLTRTAQLKSSVNHLERMAALARAELARAAASSEAAVAIGHRTHASVIEVPELYGVSGAALFERMATVLDAPSAVSATTPARA